MILSLMQSKLDRRHSLFIMNEIQCETTGRDAAIRRVKNDLPNELYQLLKGISVLEGEAHGYKVKILHQAGKLLGSSQTSSIQAYRQQNEFNGCESRFTAHEQELVKTLRMHKRAKHAPHGMRGLTDLL